MLRMASDPVPNIRFNVSKTLEKMAPRLEVCTLLYEGPCLVVCGFPIRNAVAVWSSKSFGFLPVSRVVLALPGKASSLAS